MCIKYYNQVGLQDSFIRFCAWNYISYNFLLKFKYSEKIDQSERTFSV